MQHVDGWMEESTLEFQPAVGITSITCANDKCRKLSLSVNPGRTVKGDRDIFLKQKWVLLPPSSAKPQPECVPEVLANDYYEACAICNLSPKALPPSLRCIGCCEAKGIRQIAIQYSGKAHSGALRRRWFGKSAVLPTPSARAYDTLKRLKRESAICERSRRGRQRPCLALGA